MNSRDDPVSFLLPPCPACSNREVLVRPFWRLARETSRVRKQRCWFFVGCKHANEVQSPARLVDDDEVVALVEESWTRRIGELFELVTARWTASERAVFARDLGGKFGVVGSTERLGLSAGEPASTKTNEPNENG